MTESTAPANVRLEHLKTAIADTYTRDASNYDAERSINRSVRFFFDRVYECIDELMGPTDSSVVHLDMPVGTGRFLFDQIDRGRRQKMLGIDISPGMVDVCAQACRSRKADIALSFGDAFALPLPDASVDIITSLRFFHLFPKRHWPRMLAEMQRVLKPGGILIAEMRNLFRAVGGGIFKEYRDRWFRQDQAHAFVHPLNVRKLFGTWDRIEMRGAGIDGLGPLVSIAPNLAAGVHAMARYAPIRYLTKELIIKARNPI